MKLRAKLFLPLALLYGVLVAYLYLSWLPSAVEYQSQVFRRLQQRELKTLGEGLIPMIVAGQLGDIHDTLDALRQENPEWLGVELVDARGRQIYPLPGTMVPAADRDSDRIESDLTLDKNPVGILRVVVSRGPLIASVRNAQAALIAVLAAATLGCFLLIALVLDLTVRRPVAHLADAARDLAAGRFDSHLPRPGRDEIGELVGTFGAMRDEVSRYQASLKDEIAERRHAEEELRRLNETLEARVRDALAKNREKDHLLIQQSRLAAMGEMVHNIAHQWRQPLNALAVLIRNIEDDYEYNTLTRDGFRHGVEDAHRLLRQMSGTIDEFREFFRPDREAVSFDVGKAVRDALFIVEASLKHYHVAIDTDLPECVLAEGFPAQFSQAILNIVVNGKEALQDRNIPAGRISARLETEEDRVRVVIEDNAGGIAADILPKIFDPYFTTKDKGSGIGLYMTKMIIEKNMNGSVHVENAADGARFTISVPRRQPRLPAALTATATHE